MISLLVVLFFISGAKSWISKCCCVLCIFWITFLSSARSKLVRSHITPRPSLAPIKQSKSKQTTFCVWSKDACLYKQVLRSYQAPCVIFTCTNRGLTTSKYFENATSKTTLETFSDASFLKVLSAWNYICLYRERCRSVFAAALRNSAWTHVHIRSAVCVRMIVQITMWFEWVTQNARYISILAQKVYKGKWIKKPQIERSYPTSK